MSQHEEADSSVHEIAALETTDDIVENLEPSDDIDSVERDRSPSSRKRRLPHWVNANTLIGVLGVALALWGILQNSSQDRFDSRLQAKELLDEALDIIGGQAGTSWVGETIDDRNKLELARRNIERALDLDRRNPRAYHRLSLYYQAIGQPLLAKENLEKAISLDSRFAVSRLEIVRLLESEGSTLEAEGILRAAAEQDPVESNLVALAGFLARNGRPSEAVAVYQQAIESNGQPYLLRELSRLHEREGDLQKAEELLAEAVSSEPRSTVGYLPELAEIQAKRGKFEEAEATFRAATTSRLVAPEFHVEYGEFLVSRARFEDAQRQFESALALKPDHREANLQLAELMDRLLKLDRAEHHYRRAMANARSNVEPLGLAGVLIMQRRLREAEEIHLRLVEREPDKANNYSNYASFLQSLGRLEDAERLLLQATERATDGGHAWHRLGDLYKHQGHLEKAEEAYAASLDADPTSLVDRFKLAEVRARRLQNGGFGSFLEATAERDLEHPWVLSSLAGLYEKEGDLETALDLYGTLAQSETGCYYYVRSLELEKRLGRLTSPIAAESLISDRFSDRENCYLHMSLFLADTGDLLQAESLLRTISARHPDRTDFIFKQGQVLAEQGRISEAEASYRAAIELTPKDTLPLYCLADLLSAEGRDTEAREARDRAKKVDDLLWYYRAWNGSCPSLRRSG